MKDNINTKVTDEQFIETLTENDGMFALTAKAIQKKYNVSYTRQAVYQRAQNFAEELATMDEELIDTADKNIRKFLNNDADPERQFKMTIYVLNNRGAARGYGKYAKPNLPAEPEGYFEIGGKEFRF